MNRRDLLKSVPALAAGRVAALSAAPAQAGRKARLRSAICAYSYRGPLQKKTMTYDDVIRLAVELDIDGIDMTVYWFPNTTDEFLLPLKRLAYRSAVEIYSIAVATEMTQADPEMQRKEAEKVKGWLEVAEKLGAGHMRVFGGRIPKGATEQQAAGWATEVLKRASEYAGKKGIILGLENHGGVTEKAATILQIVKTVDSPWVGVNLDTGNFRTNPYEQIEMCIPYAVNFQVKSEIVDGGTRQPSDWDRIIGLAAKAGYEGYLALEYEGKEDVNTAGPRLLTKLRQLTRKYSA